MSTWVVMLFLVSCALGSTVINATSSNIQITGRYASNPDGSVSFDWSGIEIAFTVVGTSSISVRWNGMANQYNVFVNGSRLTSLLEVQSGTQTYLLTSTLNPKNTNLILITKRTEAQDNPYQAEIFYNLLLDDGAQLVPPSAVSSRRMEFLGDSITCGYGLWSTPRQGPPCSDPQGRAEDNWLTYGPLTARHFGARVHVESWSGKGLLKNFGDSQIPSVDPFPIYFNRTIGITPLPLWTFSRYVPQVVVINLGTNDYSMPPTPTEEQYEDAYHQYIATIREAYGSDTKFFLVCGPMTTTFCSYVNDVASTEDNAYYVDMSNILSSNDYGCGGHPNAAGHRKMSNTLIASMNSVLNW